MARSSFYRYRDRDFVTIRAYELQRGDRLAYGFGGDMRYGVVMIEGVTKVRGEGILIQYVLPAGAMARSSEATSIAVYWRGDVPDIHIAEDIEYYAPVLILDEVH